MAITPQQLTQVEQFRKNILDTVNQGVEDEYLLATYNGLLRHLDKRLPAIKHRVEGNSYKNESREIVRRQRQARGQKTGASSGNAQGSAQKTA
ncbi:hypothetical protein [Ktedonobacter racemifer]|uniref:Uncharacterized protein n=1 Tax=Ktedonobacter racemifer DSM 44963 TaxID=485913 RepID=D6TKX0_KTERA|nr:hypothetical protein [Ktedonobacter racemifer]EFH86420.1 hypothetical protein Krac_7718 [Ktedonobacter racemifer DSM 44963]